MGRINQHFAKLFSLLLLFTSIHLFATEPDNRLNIHVHYLQASDSWKVLYELPIATDHIAFARKSNFNRQKLYTFDESKYEWDKADDVLIIRSKDGKKRKSFELAFSSYYEPVNKDYELNVKYSDGSVLLYTNHLALGANIIEDETISPIDASFQDTEFHFYGHKQNIIFLGNTYHEKATWLAQDNGTYVYFGNIKPIETDDMIAIVDPKLPEWTWKNTQKYFPELFEFYKQKTAQPLNFKPVVFFNYDQVEENFSSYSGGTLDGLVQLTINGKNWQTEDKDQFNMLFQFLAHEAAHFWNGQMFSFKEQAHSWMHEGGADAFANFAMLEFGLIDSNQVMKQFEIAANNCLLNKGNEALEDSSKLWKFRNYYTCGSTMALASHYAIQAKSPEKSLFDLWKNIFATNTEARTYNQQDYFDALSQLTDSDSLSNALSQFSGQTNNDNASTISAWFENTDMTVVPSHNYPNSIKRHWGKKVITSLMTIHCKRLSLSTYGSYVKTYPLDNCKSFDKHHEIKYLSGIDLFKDGIAAYKVFRKQCKNNENVVFQDRNKATSAEMKCLKEVAQVADYLELSPKLKL